MKTAEWNKVREQINKSGKESLAAAERAICRDDDVDGDGRGTNALMHMSTRKINKNAFRID